MYYGTEYKSGEDMPILPEPRAAAAKTNRSVYWVMLTILANQIPRGIALVAHDHDEERGTHSCSRGHHLHGLAPLMERIASVDCIVLQQSVAATHAKHSSHDNVHKTYILPLPAHPYKSG